LLFILMCIYICICMSVNCLVCVRASV
jgi:hypothetical protein